MASRSLLASWPRREFSEPCRLGRHLWWSRPFGRGCQTFFCHSHRSFSALPKEQEQTSRVPWSWRALSSQQRSAWSWRRLWLELWLFRLARCLALLSAQTSPARRVDLNGAKERYWAQQFRLCQTWSGPWRYLWSASMCSCSKDDCGFNFGATGQEWSGIKIKRLIGVNRRGM